MELLSVVSSQETRGERDVAELSIAALLAAESSRAPGDGNGTLKTDH